ncbi:MFS general substrate transporter [Meredithblackwellia eburnea MCA 4105]
MATLADTEIKVPSIEDVKRTAVVAGGIEVKDLEAPDRKKVTSRWELWSYYLYYVGNSGLGPFNFGPSQFQNLLALAGHNLDQPGVACDYSVPCVLPFAGIPQRNINSIVLVTNGISFAIQVVLFLAIGSMADFGTWRRWILVFFTAVAIGVSFGWLGVEVPSKWETATGLYVIGLIGYQGALTFWTAAFPGLARSLPEMMDSQEKLMAQETTVEAHDMLDVMSRNRLSNIAFTVCSVGELVILALCVAILKGMKSDQSTEQNTKSLSVVTAFSGAVWILLALPWFLLEKTRPGYPIPEGSNIVTAGLKTIWTALKGIRKLPDTLLYLVFYFLMSDVLNTTVTVISTIQYSLVSYNTLQVTYLLIVGIFTQAVGIYAFWWVQKMFRLSTLFMFNVVIFWTMVLVGWGLIGAWTDKFGFKHVGEIWAYQAFYGLLVCPWYSYSQTMVSELIPTGKEFLFFSLFSISGKTSAFIGPFVTSAISARTNNTSDSFYFLFALGAVSCILLFFINIPRSRRHCKEFLDAEAKVLKLS